MWGQDMGDHFHEMQRLINEGKTFTAEKDQTWEVIDMLRLEKE